MTPLTPKRTPPDLKWLLNERAALAGELKKATEKQALLMRRQVLLERRLCKVLQALERSQVAQARSQASLTALDTTMAVLSAQLNPSAGGTVQAWAGKYGSRGGLVVFIAELLQGAAPEPLTMSVLVVTAAAHFQVALMTPTERRNFRKSVSSALSSLLKRQLIEPLHSREEGSHGLWKWGQTLPRLSDIVAQEAAWR